MLTPAYLRAPVDAAAAVLETALVDTGVALTVVGAAVEVTLVELATGEVVFEDEIALEEEEIFETELIFEVDDVLEMEDTLVNVGDAEVTLVTRVVVVTPGFVAEFEGLVAAGEDFAEVAVPTTHW